MKRVLSILIVVVLVFAIGCSTSYKAKPLPFRSPSSYGNVVTVNGAQVAAGAYDDPKKAKDAFGFDVRGAGMLPVQVVFDNQGQHPLEINGTQTFLEDSEGNLWPILSTKIAYERATKYAHTKQIFKAGAYSGFLGATAGAIVGAAVGIVTQEDIGVAVAKGAAVGAAGGAVMGGAGGYASNDARRAITGDLKEKSLQNRSVGPKTIAHGFIFFPGEAKSAKQLRLQIKETDTGNIHVLMFKF
jgi:hypothetical protein